MFQIETALWNDEGKIKVSKRNLYNEGQKHIDNIVETYKIYADSGLVCGLEKIGNKIFFEYIIGETFEKQLISALQNTDKIKVQNLAGKYNHVVDEICLLEKNSTEHIEEENSNVFGEMLYDVNGYSNIIFDLTFDNIIFDGNRYKVIDYEWRFDFPLEKEFVKFRAVYAFAMKWKALIEGTYSLEEFYELFNVSQENIERYLEYNKNFIKYVYGEGGYNDIIKNYEKVSVDLFNEEFVNTLKLMQKRKNADVDSYENMFFNKLLTSIEKNKDLYDDYNKFYKVTKKVRNLSPNGFTETKEFVEEFSAYIDDLYSMINYYKNDVVEYYKKELEKANSESEKKLGEQSKKSNFFRFKK